MGDNGNCNGCGEYKTITEVTRCLEEIVQSSPLPKHLRGQISNIVVELSTMPKMLREQYDQGGSSALNHDD